MERVCESESGEEIVKEAFCGWMFYLEVFLGKVTIGVVFICFKRVRARGCIVSLTRSGVAVKVGVVLCTLATCRSLL